MTQSEFKTYVNLLLTQPKHFYILKDVAECQGASYCDNHACPFDTRESESECQLQDRDKLTKTQLTKLQSDFPEYFI